MRLTNYCGVLVSVLLFAGCSQKTPEEYIAEAETAIYAKESNKAIIVLKNALGSDPKNLKARYLLGRLYHEEGNVVSAEKELKIAYKGGYFKNEVLPIYVSSLNFQRKDEELVALADGLTGLSSETEAAVQTYKGLALFRLNEISRAKLAIKRANELSPESPYSIYGRANLAIFENEQQDALIILDELLANDPEFMEAVFLQGKLSVLTKDYETAIKSFKKYVDKKPGDIQGNISLANALIKNENYEEGEKLVNLLLSKLKDNPYLSQLKGIIEFNNENYEGAKLAMETAISNGLNEPAARLVAGVSAYKLDKMEQAHNHLLAARDSLPNSHPARRLLAEIQLRLGYTSGAVESVQGFSDMNLDDARLFTQTSSDLIKARDYEKANQLLDVAKQLGANDTDELLRIALLKLSLNVDSAIADLEDILTDSPNNAAAIISLSQAYVQTERFNEAIDIAVRWAESEPDNVAALNLLALVYEKASELKLAEEVFTKALVISKNNPVSLEFFAKQALADGNEQKSLELRKQLAENNPQYIQGLFEYFAYAHEQGDSEHAFELLKTSYLNNKSDIQFILNYARALVLKIEPQKVIDVLNTIEYQKDLPLFFWKAKSDSYIKLGDLKSAKAVYADWQKIEPNNLYSWLGYLTILDRLSEHANALKTVNSAKEFFPNEPYLKLLEVHYNLINKNLSVAKRLYNGLDDELKNLPFAKGLKGQFYYADGEFDKAIPLLQEYYDDTENGRVAQILANAKRNNGDIAGSIETLESHLNNNVNDMLNRLHLAERYMAINPEQAIKHYRVALKQQDNNLLILNNLAWLLSEQGELAEALVMIKKAIDLNSDNSAINNTYGNILIKNDEFAEATIYLKKAFDELPSNNKYRVDYERALELAN